MDVSEEYAEMCEKAIEIQNLHIEQGGNFYYALHNHFRETTLITGESEHNINFKTGWCDVDGFSEGGVVQYQKIIWLPRQDQLQEMIEANFLLFFEKVYRFINDNIPYARGKSIEQIYLCLLMKENYNKKWNGLNWEVINASV